MKDIVIQSTSIGESTFTGAYTVNPAGQIGGVSEDWTQWQEVAALPSARLFFAAEVFNGALYSLGGGTNVYRYDGTNWTEVAGLPAARWAVAAGVLNGALYVIGGCETDAPCTNVYRYDGTNWAEVAGLPTALRDLAVGVLNGALYTVGGCDYAGNYFNVHTNVYRYDGTNWTEVAGLTAARSQLAAGVLNGALYAIGGGDDYQIIQVQTNVYRYDGTNWTEVAGLPDARMNLAAGVLNGALYAIGGFDFYGYDGHSNVYRYPRVVVDTGVSPSSGSYTGGYQVVITGTNLCDGTLGNITSVTLCGVTAAVTSVSGSTQIVVTAGPAVIGLGDVVVCSTSYGTTIKSNGFTYTAAITAVAGPHGAVAPSGVVDVAYGGSTSFVVTADAYYHIGRLLTNGVDVWAAANQPAYTSAWMNVTATGTLAATFAENLTTSTRTPEWWLAHYGLSTDDAGALYEDGDGMPAWKEYLADTDPTNALSVLRVTNIVFESNNVCVGWSGGQQVWQYLERAANLLDTGTIWTILWSNPPPNATATNFTDSSATNAAQFYRIRSFRQ